MKTFVSLFFLCIACVLSASAQDAVGRIDNFFNELNHTGRLNGTVLIAEKGSIIYQQNFGYASLENKTPIGPHTTFNLASLSKPFTAVSILQLVEKHKLGLDDHLVKYFPAFPYSNITISQLLSHSSGLSDQDLAQAVSTFRKQHGREYMNADLVQLLADAKVKLKLQPGEKWWYCNMGYQLLATLVEKLSGMSFGTYLSKNIFLPAGMRDSYLMVSGMSPRVGQAGQYDYVKRYDTVKQRLDLNRGDYSYATFGESNVESNAADLFRFSSALFGEKLISKAMLIKATTGTQLIDDKPNNVWLNIGGMGLTVDGLGWFIFKDENMGKTVFHAGGMAGAVTILLHNITKDQTVIVLDNTSSEGLYKNAQQALNILDGKPIEPAKVNLTRLYVRTLMAKGNDAAAALLLSARPDTARYSLSENDLNNLSYDLLQSGHLTQALETFRMNCLLFPMSDNAFESYGEALEQAGFKNEALLIYRRSLDIAPANADAKKALQRLIK